ncbi:hypothetical protein ACFYS8_03085 [Kitasatospora sp. NPDC004615]|uniref:hypothetical protein n=1 Tax=Kitasatospora sp. NPDC004615 TaxID=3364017 RepID=UPI00369CCC49
MVFTVGVVGWDALRLTDRQVPFVADAVRAERLAGLGVEQHPGKGRYYVPEQAVLVRRANGGAVGYLHYRLGGGVDVNVEDFLRTYDLGEPGGAVAIPEDLREALPGDEPGDGALVPGQAGRQVFVVRAVGGELPGGGDVYVRAEGQG